MGARILAIDDSDQNLSLIELHLQDTEFEVVTARSGPEGLERVRREEFDLILLDVVMPRMDGFECCERLKADPRTKEIPVIFLTGEMQAESHKLYAFEIGAVDYLSKPVHGEELIARIRVMLRLRESSAELERENIDLIHRLQQTQAAVDLLQSEIGDLRALETEGGGAVGELAWVDPAGAIRDADPALVEVLGTVPTPAFPPLARWLQTGDAQTSELWFDLGEESRCFEVRRVPMPAEFGDNVLLSMADVTRAREIRRSMEARRGREPIEVATPEPVGYRMTGCIGSSAAMREVSQMVDRLRNVRSTVLIYGESGTGKEIVARALHFDGKFKAQPFIPIHCGAISPHIIESELFGHEKGAFTGAASASRGLLTAADGGTVFLDELAETTPDLQIKLLRVLQLGEVRPVGSTNSQRVDVRFIAATNGDLPAKVRANEFREDLFHRLNVVTIHLPPLRERASDVVPIAEHFLEKYCKRHDRETLVELSQAASRLLEDYPWPGNVRELENVIDGALSLGCGDVLQAADLPPQVRECRPPMLHADQAPPEHATTGSRSFVLPNLRARRAQVDRRAIVEALERFDGDKQAAAEFLGMSRSTFYRKLKEQNVK